MVIRRYVLMFLALCGVVGVLMAQGCASLGLGEEDELQIRRAYAMAVSAYVEMGEAYADAYDTAAPEVQTKWKAQITPRFLQASEALRIWRDALENTDARAAADRAITDLTILMVDMGILTIG